MRKWLLCLAFVASCNKRSGESAAEYDRRMYQDMHDALVAPARRGPAFATTPVPLPSKPEGPGAAYFYVKDVGLVTFGLDGAVTQQKLALTRVGKLIVAADAVIVGADHVYKIEHGAARRVGGDDSPSVEALTSALKVAPDGKIWLANRQGVFAWDGAKWTKYSTTESVHDLAFDGSGRTYTASTKQLGVIDGGRWQKMYDLEGTPHEGVVSNPRFWTIDVVGKQLVATHSFGMLKLDGADVEAIDRKAMDPKLTNGRVLGGDYVSVNEGAESSLVHTPLAGGPDKVVPIRTTGIAIDANIMQLDARGRAWISPGTSELAVVAADGSMTRWPVATIPEITSSIEAIYVVGNGPDKLPGQTAVAKGTIRGRVMNKQTPLAKAYVEICQHPNNRIPKGQTPCSYSSHGTGETDDRGAFSISGLPLQDYRVVIRDGDKWYSLFGSTCGGMHDGDTCDVGELDITNKPFPTTP